MEAGECLDAFPLDAWQGGAGTSLNMNMNEVLANLALVALGHKPGDYDAIGPLDHVNRHQSTNDVYPTALKVAAIRALRQASEGVQSLRFVSGTALSAVVAAVNTVKESS